MNSYVNDIANLIQVRAFINSMVESMTVKLTREEVKAIQQKVAQMDKTILERSLSLDLAQVAVPLGKPVQVFNSTEDLKDVMERIRAENKKLTADNYFVAADANKAPTTNAEPSKTRPSIKKSAPKDQTEVK